MGVIGGGCAWRRTLRTAFSGQPCDETVAHEFERLTIQLHLCPRSSNAQFTLYGFHCTHTVYIRSCIVYVGCTTAETAAVFEMLGRAEPMALPVTMFSLVGGIEHEQPPSLSSCAGSRLIGLESHTSDKEDDVRLPKKCEDAGAAVDVNYCILRLSIQCFLHTVICLCMQQPYPGSTVYWSCFNCPLTDILCITCFQIEHTYTTQIQQ